MLKRHKDRPSCEISTTVNLGGDPWPIFIDGTGKKRHRRYKNIHKPNAPKGTKVLLDVGDMLDIVVVVTIGQDFYRLKGTFVAKVLSLINDHLNGCLHF